MSFYKNSYKDKKYSVLTDSNNALFYIPRSWFRNNFTQYLWPDPEINKKDSKSIDTLIKKAIQPPDTWIVKPVNKIYFSTSE